MRFLPRKRKKKKDEKTSSAKSRFLTAEHGATYQAFVQRQLSDERERFAGLEEKANSLISGSGTLVTLILAIGALSTNSATFALSPLMRVAAVVGLTLFILAAIAGLLGIKTREYSIPTADALDHIQKDREIWTKAEPAARGIVMQFDISTIRTLRQVNNEKARWVARGRFTQILAVVALTLTAVIGLSK